MGLEGSFRILLGLLSCFGDPREVLGGLLGLLCRLEGTFGCTWALWGEGLRDPWDLCHLGVPSMAPLGILGMLSCFHRGALGEPWAALEAWGGPGEALEFICFERRPCKIHCFKEQSVHLDSSRGSFPDHSCVNSCTDLLVVMLLVAGAG